MATQTVPAKLAASLVEQQTNTSAPNLVHLFTHALVQLCSMKTCKDYHVYWTIKQASKIGVIDPGSVEEDQLDSDAAALSSMDSQAIELYYRTQWKAVFVFGMELLSEEEEEQQRWQEMDGAALTLRYTQEKWYFCNF